MKFELDDDTVLRLSGVATAAYSVMPLVVPRTSHDTFYVAQASDRKERDGGVVLYTCITSLRPLLCGMSVAAAAASAAACSSPCSRCCERTALLHTRSAASRPPAQHAMLAAV